MKEVITNLYGKKHDKTKLSKTLCTMVSFLVCISLILPIFAVNSGNSNPPKKFNQPSRKLFSADDSKRKPSKPVSAKPASPPANSSDTKQPTPSSVGSIGGINQSTLLPTSGSEPIYNPSYWNSKGVVDIANCYAYASNTAKDLITGKPLHSVINSLVSGDVYAMQPGMYCKKTLNEDFSNIVELLEEDAKITGRTFRPIGKHQAASKGNYKIALVVAVETNRKGEQIGIDYHFYRQNPDGTWSHKPGSTKITLLDNSQKIITDPETADRNGEKMGAPNYNKFIGFFEVGPKKP